jgi:pseudouridine synthase
VRPLGVGRDGSSWIEIGLGEGRNRQVRRMCAAVGHDVLELVRVRIGQLALGDLRPGEWRRLTPEEVAQAAGPVRRSSPGRM